MRRRRGTAALAALGAMLAVTVFAGCAGAGPSPEEAGQAGASSASEPAGDSDATLLCQGTAVSVRALRDAKPATDLDPDVVAVLEGPLMPIEAPLSDWVIETETAGYVVIMRPIEPPLDLGGGELVDHDLVAISAGAEHAIPLTAPWGLDRATSCALRIDLGGLVEARVALDPAAIPEAGDERISLLVTESACNSGDPATGRVELVELVETETTVEIVIGVRPDVNDDGSPSMHTCQGNPPTPFTVELRQPLGDRAILDAAVVPSRAIVAGHLR